MFSCVLESYGACTVYFSCELCYISLVNSATFSLQNRLSVELLPFQLLPPVTPRVTLGVRSNSLWWELLPE